MYLIVSQKKFKMPINYKVLKYKKNHMLCFVIHCEPACIPLLLLISLQLKHFNEQQ